MATGTNLQGGGVNGAVFFKHLESGLKEENILLPWEESHRPFIGVFKPHPETVREFKGWFDFHQWAERIKDVKGMAACLNKLDPDCRVHNEIFAYELFHIFGFNQYIRFPTTILVPNKNDAQGRIASFCDFIPDYELVESYVKPVQKCLLDEANRKYSEDELFIWQMSKIFDFMTGNMDGHAKNAFVKIMNDMLVGVVNFDYDKAFAVIKTPNIHNQYKWGNLEISKRKFTEKTKFMLKLMFRDILDKTEAFLNKAREGNPEKFNGEQAELFFERNKILQDIISGKIQSLSDLAKYK